MQTNDEYSDERIPFGYLLTFRSFGTSLHGTRGSVDRFHNVYGTPCLSAAEKRKQYNSRLLKQSPVKLTAAQRAESWPQSKKPVKFANGNCGLRTFGRTMLCGHFCQLQTGANTERAESQCNAQDERSRLLELRAKSLGLSRQQEVFMDGKGSGQCDSLCLYEQGDPLP